MRSSFWKVDSTEKSVVVEVLMKKLEDKPR